MQTKEGVERPSQRVPDDVEQLKLKNLDTGEEYIIGENDPDFEFDTFELRGSSNDHRPDDEEDLVSRIINWLFGSFKPARVPPPNVPKHRFTKLSSFKFRRELGKGAFGRVLLAEVKDDGALFAIKIISKKNMRQSDKRQALAERNILHSMAHASPHPFTTGLKFAFQSENNLYLGMEYLPGGNLRQLIQRFGCLPEDWVRFYAAELVLALSHLHSLNVLYRDIKPHNVMLDAKGHIILIDYGLSKVEVYNPFGAQSLVGTPDYSAPEVLKTGVYRIENAEREKQGKKPKPSSKEAGNIGYGKAADWWSLGIMIYEMLGGTPTFRGSDLRQTYQRVLYADLVFVPEANFSESAKELLVGLLQRDPSKRLGGADNSPDDIKSRAFFNNVDWDAVYNRTVDGPWLPEIRDFRGKKLHVNDAESDKGGSDSDLEHEQSEVVHVRDSIITPHDPNKKDKNRLHDWSYIDEKALAAAAAGRPRLV